MPYTNECESSCSNMLWKLFNDNGLAESIQNNSKSFPQAKKAHNITLHISSKDTECVFLMITVCDWIETCLRNLNLINKVGLFPEALSKFHHFSALRYFTGTNILIDAFLFPKKNKRLLDFHLHLTEFSLISLSHGIPKTTESSEYKNSCQNIHGRE